MPQCFNRLSKQLPAVAKASLATAREELAACRQTEQNAQERPRLSCQVESTHVGVDCRLCEEELLKVEGTCAVEELRVANSGPRRSKLKRGRFRHFDKDAGRLRCCAIRSVTWRLVAYCLES